MKRYRLWKNRLMGKQNKENFNVNVIGLKGVYKNYDNTNRLNPHSTRTANAAREFIRYTAIDIKREG